MDEITATETITKPLTFVEANPPPTSPEKKENFPVSIADIKENDTLAVIHNVVKAMDEGKKVPLILLRRFFPNILITLPKTTFILPKKVRRFFTVKTTDKLLQSSLPPVLLRSPGRKIRKKLRLENLPLEMNIIR